MEQRNLPIGEGLGQGPVKEYDKEAANTLRKTRSIQGKICDDGDLEVVGGRPRLTMSFGLASRLPVLPSNFRADTILFVYYCISKQMLLISRLKSLRSDMASEPGTANIAS